MAFVDNPMTPAACLVVIGFLNIAFLGGKPEQDWINPTFARLRRDRSLLLTWASWVRIGVPPPPDLTRAIDRYEFSDLPVSLNQQGRTVQLPQDHHFRRMDQELLTRCRWRDQMMMAYGTIENFLEHGFGICLMRGDEICCEAYAAFRAAGRYEIGVITPEAYRRRGYAYMTCTQVVEECAKEGYQTSWSCEQENTASVATARKLGYKTQREYQLLYYAQNS